MAVLQLDSLFDNLTNSSDINMHRCDIMFYAVLQITNTSLLSSKYIFMNELVNMICCICCRFYVGCNMCAEWFHGSCVGVSANDVHNLSSFVCPSCSQKSAQTKSEELHCICQTPYDESKYDFCLFIIFLFLLCEYDLCPSVLGRC